MKFKKIKVSNFKSFQNLDLSINDFTVLIGPNASGKSIFVDIFQFLSDIFNYGLDNAISMQGGRDYIRNVNTKDRNINISIMLDCGEDELSLPITKRDFISKKGFPISYTLEVEEIIYELNVYFVETRKVHKITSEKLKLKGKLMEVVMSRKKRELELKYVDRGKSNFDIDRTEKKVYFKFESDNKDIKISNKDIMSRYFYDWKLSKNLDPKEIYINSNLMPIMLSDFVKYLKNIIVYNIDPKLPKRSTLITGKNILESDGSNLAIVLKKILENKENKKKFSSLIKNVLPFVEDLAIERFSDKSLIASLKETYSKKKYFPASLLSDGTINIIALIIILYFEEKDFIIIEEPEKRIHPNLIAKIMNMMNDVKDKKQLIITTHNPEVVRYTDIEYLYIIRRDKEGFSNIEKVTNMEHLKKFLENEIGLEELFVEDLLR